MSLLFAILFYAATLILVGGVAYRVYDYARTPAPLNIPPRRRQPRRVASPSHVPRSGVF